MEAQDSAFLVSNFVILSPIVIFARHRIFSVLSATTANSTHRM